MIERAEWTEKLEKAAAYMDAITTRSTQLEQENAALKEEVMRLSETDNLIKTAMALVEDGATEPFMTFNEMLSTGNEHIAMHKEAAPTRMSSSLSLGKVATRTSGPSNNAVDRFVYNTLRIGEE